MRTDAGGGAVGRRRRPKCRKCSEKLYRILKGSGEVHPISVERAIPIPIVIWYCTECDSYYYEAVENSKIIPAAGRIRISWPPSKEDMTLIERAWEDYFE